MDGLINGLEPNYLKGKSIFPLLKLRFSENLTEINPDRFPTYGKKFSAASVTCRLLDIPTKYLQLEIQPLTWQGGQNWSATHLLQSYIGLTL